MADAGGVKLAILGAGSWGTALACALADGGPTVLWTRHAHEAEAIRLARRNPRYLTETVLPLALEVTGDLAQAVAGAAIVVMAVPAKGMEAAARGLSAVLRTQARRGDDGPLVLSGAKGLDPESGRLMSQVLSESLGDRAVVGALSGPNIAREVAQGLPTATVIACHSAERAAGAQRRLSGRRLRAYTNDDVVGVEVGGAMKNVIAVAAGISDGLHAGDNAKAAIMTRGLSEMTRLGIALGARATTFSGLTGLGDLVVTCSSPFSRNRMLGVSIGEGRSLAEVESSMTMIAEGVNTTREALRLGARLDVELPIAAAVSSVLFDGADLLSVAAALMSRTGRSEMEGLLG
ncbi:MAG TPA: NAD(P)H-dependent glycerol-3-phosphate dehydrogenase [Candidatus Dormibacteraeota bacterium]|jgi:glycerol-3-phosphate dehydrogenase (NAD(P)+)|nr:NAD(P)H-dependent glycerol-3-phosphate dehydrogenase [Candidatus Dormibacteraeota bacterium]